MQEGRMADELPKAVRERIGVEKAFSYEVTVRDVRRFAQAIGAGEPARLPDGRLVAPPLFCQVFMFEDVPVEKLPPDGSPTELDVPIPATRAVGGSSDFEILGTVHTGDCIKVRSKLRSVTTKEGKSGTLWFVCVETTFENQRAEMVARE